MVNGKKVDSSCRRYQLDVVRNLSAQGLVPGVDVNVTELEQEDCLDGWSYSRDVYQSTLVSEVQTFHHLSGSIAMLKMQSAVYSNIALWCKKKSQR